MESRFLPTAPDPPGEAEAPEPPSVVLDVQAEIGSLAVRTHAESCRAVAASVALVALLVSLVVGAFVVVGLLAGGARPPSDVGVPSDPAASLSSTS